MRIGVIGYNSISLAFSLLCERSGHVVTISDDNINNVELLNQKITNIDEPGLLSLIVTSSNLKATTDNIEVISNSDIIFNFTTELSLPNGKFDISKTMEIVEEFGYAFENEIPVNEKVFVICSPLNPGDTKSIFEILSPFTIDVCYNPLNVRNGSILQDFENLDLLILGTSNPITVNNLTKIYSGFSKKELNVSILSYKAAEITKLSISSFLAFKSNYANFIGDLCSVSNIENEINLVLDCLSKDKRIGGDYLKFGVGFGGPNLPKEIRSFNTYCESIGMKVSMIDDLELISESHNKFLKERLIKNNPDKEIPFNIYGISYKNNSDITVESKKLSLVYDLLNDGYMVNIVDSSLISKNKKLMLELTNDFSGKIKIYKNGTKPLGFDIKL